MATAGSFTLEDDEDSQVASLPTPSTVPVAPDAPAPTSPTSPNPLQHGASCGLGLQLRDPPKAHVDADLGVSTLAQAVSVLQNNQKEIELTETHLQNLLRQQTRLAAASKLLEQQKVLDVLAAGPELGYDAGRPIASLLVYRCCLRWGSLSADALTPAAAVLDHITSLLLQTTDEDGIYARHAAAVRGRSGGGGSSGGAAVQVPSGGDREADQGLTEQAAVTATREVAYWLAVTSTLLALVDPHLPLHAVPPNRPAGHRGGPAPAHPATTPLAAVAGDARASMARAASAAAAKVQELKKRMGNTFSGMGLLGNNLLRRRGSTGHAAAAAAAGAGGRASAGGGGGREPEAGQQPLQQQGAAGGVAVGEEALPAVEWQHSEELPPLPQPHAQAPATSPSSQPPAQAPHPMPAAGAAGPGQALSQPFRQQLDVLLQKTYNQMRDTLKRHVSAILPSCVQQPVHSLTTPHGDHAELEGVEEQAVTVHSGGGGGLEADSGGLMGGAPLAPAVPLQPWLELIAAMSQHLAQLRAAHVPRIIIRCLFKQTLAFIDVQLFNQLLLRPECCCTSNAHYLVAGLQLLDQWIAAPAQGAAAAAAATAGAGSGAVTGAGAVAVSDELSLLAEDLRHIRQAAHFLALANKGALRLDDFTAMCPALNVQQLYRLATTFWDDSPLPPQPPSPPESPAAAMASADAEGAEVAVAGAGEDGREEAEEAAVGEVAVAVAKEEEEKQGAGGGAEGEKAGAGSDGAGEEGKDEGAAEAVNGTQAEEEGAEKGPEGEAAADAATAVMEAAAAAVAAAEAAAAADEAAEAAAAVSPAASAPASPPPGGPAPAGAPDSASPSCSATVSRNVSGEVLEEMKRRHAVTNNGGLIVTFLLDDDSSPLIAPGGVVARQLLQLINEPRLHAGLAEGLPPLLRGEDCPPQVFAFMLEGGSRSSSLASSASVGPAVAAAAAATTAGGAEHAVSA